jgi:4-hydroxybenzoate polyprenyltransferase
MTQTQRVTEGQPAINTKKRNILVLLIISTRPKQWYKNILLFVGIIFSSNLLNVSMWITTLLAFVYFCMLSAAAYLLNDILDRKRDQAHPVKCLRPIASGQLRVSQALPAATVLMAASLAGAYLTVNLDFFIIAVSYLALAVLYSALLKRFVIVDVLSVSLGFVLRAVAGALAIGVIASPWLVVCSFLLALFMSFGKRWHELAILQEESSNHRPALAEYTPSLLQEFTSITAGALLVAYLLYTISLKNDLMLATTPFVIYGTFRYLYLLRTKKTAPEPEAAFKDKPLLLCFCLWGLAVIVITLYETVITRL